MTEETSPQLIGGRYETVRPIGRGGMGIVWLARDTVLGRDVAAKQIGAFPGESEGETKRAMREARAAAALNHPNVVAVYDVTEHEGTPWLVMEYVAGPTLSSAVRERGPMTPKGAADLGAQLAGALAAAHRAGIVHRDIKPANVLIGGGRPKLGDFGIARSGAEDQLTQTGLVTGTPSYMAPEVAIGDEHGEAADVWALGATIYYAVEGQDAYAGQGNALATLRHISTHPPRRPERAGELEPVLADLLSRDQDRRGTMDEVARRLENVAAGGTGGPLPVAAAGEATSVQTTALPPTSVQPTDAPTSVQAIPPGLREDRTQPPSPGPGRKRRSPLVWGLLALLLVGLVVAAVALAMTLGDARPDKTPSPSESTSVTQEPDTEPPPTQEPTQEPTQAPTQEPTSEAPTQEPTSEAPTQEPSSEAPTQEPTSEAPTQEPSSEAPTQEPSPEKEPEATKDEARALVEGYFATVTRDRNAAWGMLDPSRRATRASYDGFWSGIESVETRNVRVDEAAGTVDVTLTYHPKDRAKSVEAQTYSLSRVGGALKIAD